MKHILVTGTPGVGKSHICKILARRLKIPLIDINEIVMNESLTLGYDRKRMCLIADFKRIKKRILKKIQELNAESIILEGHYSQHIAASEIIDKAFVLRCDPRILENRLIKRGYSKNKVAENIMAEILGVCFNEAIKVYGFNRIYQINVTNKSQFEVSSKMIEIIENKILESESIDWLTKLIEDKNIEFLFNMKINH